MNCKSIREAIDTAIRRSGYSETVRAHLNDCSDCRLHADQMNSLSALLGSQPRVEAPADFEFRLRARIARAKAEPKPVLGTLEKLWSRSFSFAQAATAMVAIAVAISASTYYYTHVNEVAPTDDSVAMKALPAAQSLAGSSAKAVNEMIAKESPKPAVTVFRSASSRLTTRSQRNAGLQTVSAETIMTAPTVAKADTSDRFYVPANGKVFKTSSNLIGAEGVEMTKPRADALVF
jgi:hypothetical protein